MREATLHKLKTTEFVREDLDKQKNNLIEERIKIEAEIEMQKKQAEQARKRVEESVRERDVLNKMKTQVTYTAASSMSCPKRYTR